MKFSASYAIILNYLLELKIIFWKYQNVSILKKKKPSKKTPSKVKN